MGGLFSTPNSLKINSINSIINQSILKLSGSTTSTNSITQYVEAGEGATITNISQYVDVKQNMGSVVNAAQSSDFNATIKNDVAQSLDKQSVALLGAFDGLLQNNNVDLKTTIKNKIENLNLTEIAPICATNNNITQSVIAKRNATINNVDQIVKADFIQSCTSLVDSNMGTMSDMTNSFNQRAKVVATNPLDFLSDIFQGGATMVVMIVVVIVIGFVTLIGPGNVDANAIIKQGMQMADKNPIRQLAPTPAPTPVAVPAPVPAPAPVAVPTPAPTPVAPVAPVAPAAPTPAKN